MDLIANLSLGFGVAFPRDPFERHVREVLEELLDPTTDDLVVIEEEHPHIAHASPQDQNVPLPFSRIDPHVQQLLDAITSVGTNLSLPIVLERIVLKSQ